VRNEVNQPLTVHAALQNNKELLGKISEESAVLARVRTNFPQKMRQTDKKTENQDNKKHARQQQSARTSIDKRLIPHATMSLKISKNQGVYLIYCHISLIYMD